MSLITERIKKTHAELDENVTLVAVSKTHPFSSIQEAYDGGYRIFGESRPQELKEKHAILPKDIQWHMIGNLQKNKVKYIAPFVALIHSVDSLALLKVIDKEGKKNDRVIPFLLQLKVAKETTKSGLPLAKAQALLADDVFTAMKHVSCCGIMGMATFTDQEQTIRNEFSLLKKYFEILRSEFFVNSENFKELSMGMSSDYLIAIEQGSTMVRVGRKIFGSR